MDGIGFSKKSSLNYLAGLSGILSCFGAVGAFNASDEVSSSIFAIGSIISGFYGVNLAYKKQIKFFVDKLDLNNCAEMIYTSAVGFGTAKIISENFDLESIYSNLDTLEGLIGAVSVGTLLSIGSFLSLPHLGKAVFNIDYAALDEILAEPKKAALDSLTILSSIAAGFYF